jgi:putative N6-adenine-specific DNA methylase
LSRYQPVEYKLEGDLNIFGSDRDSGAIKISKDNCQRAIVTDVIHWSINAISDMPRISEPGWIITNPPYGERISANQDLRNLYAQFGNILRKEYAGWKVLFLCSDPNLIYQTQLDVKPVLHFSNGGINVKGYFSELI